MRLLLPEELVIVGAKELKERLLKALAAAAPAERLELDARKVTAVDLSGLQLLFALWAAAAARGHVASFAPGCRSALLDRVAAGAGFARVGPAHAPGPWTEA